MVSWTQFYMALANALAPLPLTSLFEKIRDLAQTHSGLEYFHFDREVFWNARGKMIDPFTVLAIFNRGQTDQHRAELAAMLATMLAVRETPPTCYHGIPHLDPRHSIYDDPVAMGNLFHACLSGPDKNFASAWDKAITAHGNGLGSLSIGLFWARPDEFMAVDRISAPWIESSFSLMSPPEKCPGDIYCDYLLNLQAASRKAGLTYPQITFLAWQAAHPGEGSN